MAFWARKYLPVRQQEIVDGSEDVEKNPSDLKPLEYTPVHASKRSSWAIWIPWVIIVCLVISNLYTRAKLKALTIPNQIYSPAASVIRYKNIRWTAGVADDRTPYQGWPSEENNRLWQELYDHGIDRIPMSEASQLINRTTPIKEDPGYYVITLDVFHELHCLNIMRQRIFYNSTEPVPDELTLKHMDHCIDSLRQHIMCASDITPISYAWYPNYNLTLPTTAVMHTCRDFDAVREWARARKSKEFAMKDRVDDPLGNVIHYGD